MSDLQKLKEIGSMKVFKTGDYIFRQTELGDEMYIILSGQVGVYINAVDGDPINVSKLESGDFFGENSLLEDLPRNASAIAEADTTVIAITKNNFQAVICESYSIPYRIMIGLIHQICQLYSELSKCKSGDHSLSTLSGADTLVKNDEVITIAKQVDPTQITNSTLLETDNNPMIKGFGKLFPDGHKKYRLTAPNVYDDFLINAHARCPVCKESFEGKKQYLSKLKFEKMDHDFRKHYIDFEPLWYSLWVCPHCYYTNYYLEYGSVPEYKTQNILARTAELKKQFAFQFSEPRTIDQVFTAYYLALVNAEFYNASPLKFAKIWLQLSWLYHDVNDEEMFDTASAMALRNYYDVLYKTGENLSIEQAQQCFLLLGELYLLKGDEKEALRHFFTAIKKDGGRETFNQQAEDRIHDIRKDKMNFEF
jgi:uncharacterized protein (DUF2225 family)